MLHILYSQIARARRRYYERRPHLRRRLQAPVISIGNLTVGGSSKTPLAAELARMLLEMGEQPAILSRGYGRHSASDGVVVVSDGRSIYADVAQAGDEPMMLARMVPRASVLVSASRFVAGRLAESRLASTVHVLDDGFQHFDLMRDIDLLVAPDSLDGVRTLPGGRFREPLDAAAAADALLVDRAEARVAQDFSPVSASAIAARLGVPIAFEFGRRLMGPPADRPAFALAGIARPERFYGDLERAGWQLTGRRSFRDHHAYSRRDIEEVERAARASGAQLILTTEKDAVRLTNIATTLPIVAMPLVVSIVPSFKPWLAERLREVRSA